MLSVSLAVTLLSVVAQDPPKPKQEEKKVVVTATRREADPFEAPYAVDTVDRDEIRMERLSRTLPDALAETPGVMVQKTSPGQGSPFIRGFTGFRTLLMVDGIRLNNSTFREGPNQYWNTVDPLTLERLEVVRGPSSVLYGSDAVGGAVNAITLSPDAWVDDGIGTGGRAYGRYASGDQSYIGRLEGQATWDRQVGVIAGGSWRDFNDVEGGVHVGRQRHTGYLERNGDVKVEARPLDNMRVVAGWQVVNQDDVWRSHATIFGISWQGTAVGTDLYRILDQDRRLGYAQLHWEKLGGFVDAVHASLSFHEQDEFEERRRSGSGSNRITKQGVEVDTLGFWLQLESETAAGHFTYGVDYYLDDVSSFGRRYSSAGVFEGSNIQGPVADDATYGLLGLFVQDELKFAERWKAILGARWTRAQADADGVLDPVTNGEISVEDDWSSFTASARVMVEATKEIGIFAGLSQGFRAPNLSDLTRLDIALSGELEVPSPDLDPENFISFEIGAKARAGAWEGEAAAYYTIIDDMIVRRPTGRMVNGLLEVIKENAGDGHVYGVEFGGRWHATDVVSVFGDLIYARGEVDQFPSSAPDTDREPLSRLQPMTARVGVRAEPAELPIWAEAHVTIVDAGDRLSSADKRDTQRIPPNGTPGYVLYGVRGGWHFSKWGTASLSIENLTNRDYRVHGSGSNEPGTNAIVGVEVVY